MAVVDDVLVALGLVKIPATARNVLRWPPPPLAPALAPRLVEGVLAHVAGDLTTDTTLRPRVSYVLGPGATLGGVAAELTDLLATITTRTTAAPVPRRSTVVQALQTYSTTHLTNTPADRLQVGLRMPMPVEIDETTGDWVTNLETIETWARVPPPIALDWNQPVTPLPIPDPDALRADVAAELAGVANAAGLGIGLDARLLRNPFEPVFWIHEVVGVLQGARAAEVTPLVLAMAENMVNHQAELLASTSAGNAVLRRLWFAVQDVDSNALAAADRPKLARTRLLLASALGLTAIAADSWQSPYLAGASVPARELPLPAASRGLAAVLAPAGSLAAGEGARGRQVMVLGRQVSAGDVGAFDGFTGPAHVGVVAPDQFAAAHRDDFNPTGDARIDARTVIVVAIAPNEGNLDAARLRDRGMLSTGLQQWTEHGNDEATVLWEHFRGLAPDHYDLHFGLQRLLPRIWNHGEDVNSPEPATAQVVADNPWADAAVTADPLALPGAPHEHFPRWVTLYRLDPGTRVRMCQTTAHGGIGPRFAFLGGSGNAGARVFANEWSARARLVALVSIEYRTAEMETANKRFDRIARDTATATGDPNFTIPGTPAPQGGGPKPRFAVADLFTSEWGAAVVLDHHINAPGNVPGNVQAAVNSTVVADGAFDAAGALRPVWIEALAARYRVVRAFSQPAIKVQRDNFLNAVPAATLSRAAGSFAGW